VPIADSYASNPINSVIDNEDEYSLSNPNATKIVVNQERGADGSLYNRLPRVLTYMPSGWVYLGNYFNIDRVVVTTDGAGGTSSDYVDVDSFFIRHTDTQPRARSVSRVYSVGYTVGQKEIVRNTDYKGGFTVVDMSTKEQVDAYSDDTFPPIIDSNISVFDII
jgi:hypothetical protein